MNIMTLFGETEATQNCETCNKNKPVEEFYVESSSKARHNEQRRKQCKACWIIFKGRKNFRNIESFECVE